MLGAARRDAVRELGEARLAHEVAVLDLQVAGRLAVLFEQEVDPAVAAVFHLRPDPVVARKGREPSLAQGLGDQEVRAGGVDPDELERAAAGRTSTNSQLYVSLRLGFVARERKTRLPGSFSPSMAPGLAQWAVTISPVSSSISARNRL